MPAITCGAGRGLEPGCGGPSKPPATEGAVGPGGGLGDCRPLSPTRRPPFSEPYLARTLLRPHGDRGEAEHGPEHVRVVSSTDGCSVCSEVFRDSGLGGGEWAGRTWPAAPVSDGVPGGGGQGQPPHHAVRLPSFSQMARRDGRNNESTAKKTSALI